MFFLITALSPFYITVIWAILLFLKGRMNNPPALVLSVFMFFSALLFFTHASYFLGYKEFYIALDSLYLFTSLSVYPLYYCYVRMLTRDVKINYRNVWHFAPAAVLATILSVIMYYSSQEDKMVYYREVLIYQNRETIFMGGNVSLMAVVFFISRIVFAFQVIIYLVSGYRLASQYDDRLLQFYSNLQNRQLIWVRLLSLVFLFTSITSSTVNVIGRGFFLDHPEMLIIPSGLFSVLLFLIGYQGSIQQFTVKDVEEESEETDSLPQLTTTRELLKDLILDLMVKEELFRMPDLRITLLCKKLNTNRTYISSIINEEFGESFNGFINRYRVEYAKKLMKDNPACDYSLDYLASESGFGSASSFIRAFKQIEGITPGKFLKG
ncbi:helix-turn-helix domain-containing protein [Alkalitalea saponilacus]|nr:helix-turn-helix domain-containing protein [Alkalitalea saponilacus]ASB47931.1 hypothetical protein CDL62_01580 [Alkalitalea saponilacus]